jgi:hypothetical protein
MNRASNTIMEDVLVSFVRYGGFGMHSVNEHEQEKPTPDKQRASPLCTVLYVNTKKYRRG